MAKGVLIPIGGNENKGADPSIHDDLVFVQQGILAHVVKESGGKDAAILVITSASSIPEEVSKNYLDAFGKLNCSNISCLHIASQNEANQENVVKQFRDCDAVLFSGGDQSKIAKFISGTKTHEVLAERYAQESTFVIAGTSAGAMAMSTEMIAGGSSTEAFQKGAVRMRNGLGLLPDVMFDTHFIQRGRFGRVSEAVAKFPKLVGIGLAEDTGLIIRDGNEMKVIGSGMAIIFDGCELEHNNEKILDEGSPLTLVNMKVHVLSISDKYYIQERKVVVHPIGVPFDQL